MRRIRERQQRSGEVISADALRQVQLDSRTQRICPSADIVPSETSHGTALLITTALRDELGGSGASSILYGTAAADYSSGETISLTPCDSNSVDTGENDLDVTIPDDWGTVNLLSATVGGVDAVTVTCKIASGTLLQYAYAANGTPYLLGLPPTVVEFLRYDSATSHNLQLRVQWLFGTNVSTLSDWIDLMTSEESLKTSCTTPGS
jgi:hypothetical protein